MKRCETCVVGRQQRQLTSWFVAGEAADESMLEMSRTHAGRQEICWSHGIVGDEEARESRLG